MWPWFEKQEVTENSSTVGEISHGGLHCLAPSKGGACHSTCILSAIGAHSLCRVNVQLLPECSDTFSLGCILSSSPTFSSVYNRCTPGGTREQATANCLDHVLASCSKYNRLANLWVHFKNFRNIFFLIIKISTCHKTCLPKEPNIISSYVTRAYGR